MAPVLHHDRIRPYLAGHLFSNSKLEQFFTRTPNIQSYPEEGRTESLACPQTGINVLGVNTE